MDDITMKKLQNAMTDVFDLVANFNDEEKMIFAFLSTAENGDICEKLTPNNTEKYNGEFNLKDDDRIISAHFKKGKLHAMAGAAWTETYDEDKVKKAWVKDNQILAIDIDGKKLILDEQQNVLVENKDGLEFYKIIAPFENQPELTVASE